MNVAGSSDYEAGFKDGERFEQRLRQAASSLLLLQNKASTNRNKDLRNQSRGLIGEWLQIYSKKRWEETKGSEPTIEKMARDIAEGWKQIIGLLLTELQRQISESTEELEKELNKNTKKESDNIRIKNPEFNLLLRKLKELSVTSYKIDTIKKYIRLSKPSHLRAGRPKIIRKQGVGVIS